jgi:uncharacterized protein GlcG (DUF336 family)
MYHKIYVINITFIFFMFGIFSTAVSAEDLPKQSVLPLKLASQAADAAMKKCRQDGYKVSIAVVDRSGVLTYLIRDDGAGVHTIDSSRRKAYTAASMKASTQCFAELVGRLPEVQGLRDMNDSILILGGGLPVKFAGEVVGGIGVGGAPGGKLDEVCARAGLKAIAADLYQKSE